MSLVDFPFQTIERHTASRGRLTLRHVIFDFDGTLSMVRGGWAELMVEGFMRWLPVRQDESKAQVAEQLRREVLALNGKQTIFQMVHFVECMRERGASPKEPEWYKARYQEDLLRQTAERLSSLRSGSVPPSRYLVHGARAVLDKLQTSGLRLYLVSGTEYKYVREEAEALGIAPLFGDHIYGPHGDDQSFSKMKVMSQIVESHHVPPQELLSFGDGPVEIQNTRTLGGVAVGVASDEMELGSGRIDDFKRHLLLNAGADYIAPDYREIPAFVDWLGQ
jgi:phosphoglycolate phosphatase